MARRKTTARQRHRNDHALDGLEEIFLGEGGPRVHGSERQRIEGLGSSITEGVRRRMLRGLHPHLVAEVLSLAYRRVSQPAFLTAANLSMTEAYAEVGRLFLHGLLHPQSARVSKRAR